MAVRRKSVTALPARPPRKEQKWTLSPAVFCTLVVHVFIIMCNCVSAHEASWGIFNLMFCILHLALLLPGDRTPHYFKVCGSGVYDRFAHFHKSKPFSEKKELKKTLQT